MKTVSYVDQVRARADRAAELERENAELREELRVLEDAANLRNLLREIVDAAPNCHVDWTKPTTWTGYTITDYDWRDSTPERFEAAVYKAFKFFNPELTKDEAPPADSVSA